MARSDLLISLVQAGRATPDPRFRSAVEALIAEERGKRHDALADQLSTALGNGLNGQARQVPSGSATVPDLLLELNPDRGLSTLLLPARVQSECRGMIEEQQRSELLQSYGLAPRHRVLLVGPPGNGKTSVATAIAFELAAPLLIVRYEGLIGSYLGETAARLRRVFEYARQRRCVLFFDEFDTVGKERGDVHETGEIKRVVSTLLLQMDQLPPHVVIVTATNHSELLDRAVWRRFQLRLELPPPTPKQIDEFFGRLFAEFKFAGGRKLPRFGAQLRCATFSDVEDIYRDVARRSALQGQGADAISILRDRVTAWAQRAVPPRTPRSPASKQGSVGGSRAEARRRR